MSKYHNTPVILDGVKFASKAECRRYQELVMLQSAGLIRDLRLHTAYPIIVNGIKICTYIDDFDYVNVETTEYIVEDVKGGEGGKGTITPVYKLKKKLMRATYNICIVEVQA